MGGRKVARWRFGTALLTGVIGLAGPAFATEGGNGHYIPGARNLVAGILPPPGTYVTVESGITKASLDGLLMSGVVLTNVDTDAFVTKLSMTRS
jgi:hypothetical protein